MTVEEIELRKILKQMLADVGINRETLKEMVKEMISEKIEKAIKDTLHETPGGSTFKEKLSSYVLKETCSWQFKNECRRVMEECVKENLKTLRINVNVEKIEQNKRSAEWRKRNH